MEININIQDLSIASKALDELLDTLLEPEQVTKALALDKAIQPHLRTFSQLQKNIGKMIQKLDIPKEAIGNKEYQDAAKAVLALGLGKENTYEYENLASAMTEFSVMLDKEIELSVTPLNYEEIKALKPKGSIIKCLGDFIIL